MISGAYYQSIFPCETYEEIAAALSQYINCLIELNDGELNKALNDMRDKVLEPIRKLAKG